jgi:hypothetical protein
VARIMLTRLFCVNRFFTTSLSIRFVCWFSMQVDASTVSFFAFSALYLGLYAISGTIGLLAKRKK